MRKMLSKQFNKRVLISLFFVDWNIFMYIRQKFVRLIGKRCVLVQSSVVNMSKSVVLRLKQWGPGRVLMSVRKICVSASRHVTAPATAATNVNSCACRTRVSIHVPPFCCHPLLFYKTNIFAASILPPAGLLNLIVYRCRETKANGPYRKLSG